MKFVHVYKVLSGYTSSFSWYWGKFKQTDRQMDINT